MGLQAAANSMAVPMGAVPEKGHAVGQQDERLSSLRGVPMTYWLAGRSAAVKAALNLVGFVRNAI